MSSTNTYTQTIPYFYIIRHIKSGKLYAGSKYAKGCNPNTFMIPDGYTTSSTTINSIIEFEGLSSFEILRIDTNLDGVSAYNYETSFLEINNCATDPNWYNKHNNGANIVQTKEIRSKIKQTTLTLYGCEYITQTPEFIEKSKQTKKELYDDEYYNNREKMKSTKMDRHGNVNYVNKEQAKQTKKELYNEEYYNNREKFEQTCLEKYNVKNVFQLEATKQKIKETNLEKFGYVHPMQSKKTVVKGKNTCLELYGVDNYSKVPFLCIIEKKKSYPKCGISKYYPELKQFY